MNWDQSLLRKFSCTGHYRLLNQVRSELKTQPLIRDKNTRQLNLQAKPIRGTSSRQPKRPNVLENIDIEKPLEEQNNELRKSFKDRLNAIDMR